MEKDGGADRKRQRTEGGGVNPRAEKGVAMQDQRSVAKMENRPGSAETSNPLVLGRMTERQMISRAIEESKRMAPKEIPPPSDDGEDSELVRPKVRKYRHLARSPARHNARSTANGSQPRTPVANALKKKRRAQDCPYEDAVRNRSRKKKNGRPLTPRSRKNQSEAKEIEKEASFFSSSAREVPVCVEPGALAATADSPPGEGCLEPPESSRGSLATDTTMLELERDLRNRDRARNCRTTPLSDAESMDSQSQGGEGNLHCIPRGSADVDLPAGGSSQPSSHDTTCRRESCSDAEEEASAKAATTPVHCLVQIEGSLRRSNQDTQIVSSGLELHHPVESRKQASSKPKGKREATMEEIGAIPADEVYRETFDLDCSALFEHQKTNNLPEAETGEDLKPQHPESQHPQTPPGLDRHRADASPLTPNVMSLSTRLAPAMSHQTPPVLRSLRLRVDLEAATSKEQQRSVRLRTWGRAPTKCAPRRSGRVAALEAEKLATSADEPLSPTASMIKPECDIFECHGLTAGAGPACLPSFPTSHSSGLGGICESAAPKLGIRAPRSKFSRSTSRRSVCIWPPRVRSDGHGPVVPGNVWGLGLASRYFRRMRPSPSSRSSAFCRPTKPRVSLINACFRHALRATQPRKAKDFLRECEEEECPAASMKTASAVPQPAGPEHLHGSCTVKTEPSDGNVGPENLGCVLEGMASTSGRVGPSLCEQILVCFQYAWWAFQMAEGRLKAAIQCEAVERRRSASPGASEDASGGSPECDDEQGPPPPPLAWGGKLHYKAAKLWGLTLEDTSKLLCTPNYNSQLEQFLALQATAMECTLRGRTTRSMPTACLMPPRKSSFFDGHKELLELNGLVYLELASLRSVLNHIYPAPMCASEFLTGNVMVKQQVSLMETRIAKIAGSAKAKVNDPDAQVENADHAPRSEICQVCQRGC